MYVKKNLIREVYIYVYEFFPAFLLQQHCLPVIFGVMLLARLGAGAAVDLGDVAGGVVVAAVGLRRVGLAGRPRRSRSRGDANVARHRGLDRATVRQGRPRKNKRTL